MGTLKKVNMFVGRTQPFTLGHLKCIKQLYEQNNLPVVLFLIANTKFDSKHPFSDALIRKEIEYVLKDTPYLADIIYIKFPNLRQMTKDMMAKGYTPILWGTGSDRLDAYARMHDMFYHSTELNFDKDFQMYEIKRTDDDISATKVREAIKNDDIDTYNKMMPDGADKFFDDFKDELSAIKESNRSLIPLSIYIKESLLEPEDDLVNKDLYCPKTKGELLELLKQEFEKHSTDDVVDLNHIDVSHIIDMSELFKEFKQYNFDISEWDVSNVTYMHNIFYKCKKFNCDLSNWDVSNVETAWCMFYDCYKFNSDISEWDVSNVTDMSFMFSGCKNFNSDLSEWDVSNVTYMHNIFYKCKKFNCDLSNWDVSNVETAWCMFYDCEKFNSDLSGWDVSKVNYISSMFFGCKNFNSDLSKWDVSKVENMSGMFHGCKKFNSDLSKWDVSNVTTMKKMFTACDNFNSDLSKWNVSNVVDMKDIFKGCTSMKKLPEWYKE